MLKNNRIYNCKKRAILYKQRFFSRNNLPHRANPHFFCKFAAKCKIFINNQIQLIMKKYYFLLVAMMMAVMSVSLTACGDDNDEPEGGDIIGTWSCDTNKRIIDFLDEFYTGGESLCQFRADGTYVAVDIAYYNEEWAEIEASYNEDFTNPEIIIERGTYRLSGNTLHMTPNEGEYYETYWNCKINGKKMTLTLTEGIVMSFNFTKVSDSVINKYL